MPLNSFIFMKMMLKKFLPVLFLFAFVSPLQAAETGRGTALLAEDDEFWSRFALYYSYETGQWITAMPGRIFTTGEEKPEYELPYLKENPPAIRYPLWAAGREWEGKFLVAVEIRTDGSVGRSKVMRSTGHESMDRAALNAVRLWKFVPARYKGKAVVSCIQVPIYFKMK